VKRFDGSRLVAVWPGIGQVGITAGYYLLSKLRMHEEKPPGTTDFFDLDHLDVDRGLARIGPVPEDHLYACQDLRIPGRLSLMIGEAQPMAHGPEYCRRILDRVEKLGVRQVITFTAVAANSHPLEPSQVLGVATGLEGLEQLRRHGIDTLEEGQILGMNGQILAAAAERGISGLCLMGVMPALATSVPFPKASHAVLSAFSRVADVPIELGELEEYGRIVSQRLSTGLDRLQELLRGAEGEEPSEAPGSLDDSPDSQAPADETPRIEDRRRVEELFQEAARDPSKAFDLKRELDRLSLFQIYENRFLDLFRPRS